MNSAFYIFRSMTFFVLIAVIAINLNSNDKDRTADHTCEIQRSNDLKSCLRVDDPRGQYICDQGALKRYKECIGE